MEESRLAQREKELAELEEINNARTAELAKLEEQTQGR